MFIGGAAAYPLVADAQQKPMPDRHSEQLHGQPELPAFNQGLSKIGYVETRNVAIEYRLNEGGYERLPAMADEVIK